MKLLKFLALLLLVVSINKCHANDLIIVSADWCHNCVKLKSFIDKNPELFKKFDSVEILDIDQNQDLKEKLNIKSIPVSIIFNDDGSIKSQKNGYDRSYHKWIKEN